LVRVALCILCIDKFCRTHRGTPTAQALATLSSFATLSQLPLQFMAWDTALTPTVFYTQFFLQLAVNGVFLGMIAALSIYAAEGYVEPHRSHFIALYLVLHRSHFISYCIGRTLSRIAYLSLPGST
jgi:hypothetical protein